jgi:hypothetical protein
MRHGGQRVLDIGFPSKATWVTRDYRSNFIVNITEVRVIHDYRRNFIGNITEAPVTHDYRINFIGTIAEAPVTHDYIGRQ